jgi:hypothetical protein
MHYMSSGSDYGSDFQQGYGAYMSSGSEYGVDHLMSQFDTMSFTTSDTQSDGLYTCPYRYPNPIGVPQPQVNPQGRGRRIFGVRVDRFGAEHIIVCGLGCTLISESCGIRSSRLRQACSKLPTIVPGEFHLVSVLRASRKPTEFYPTGTSIEILLIYLILYCNYMFVKHIYFMNNLIVFHLLWNIYARYV